MHIDAQTLKSDEISEHVPKKIWMNKHGNYSSSKAKHLLETGHRVDTDKSLQVITQKKTTAVLRIAEAVAIQRFKPDLCPKGNDCELESTLGVII